MDENLKKYSILDKLNVSRETCIDFERFISLILEKNQEVNIISKNTEPIIRERHIIDSAQAIDLIDLIDLNDTICSDLGSGGGLPGIVLAIMMKNLNQSMKFNLYEKSHLKSVFLRNVSRKLKLNTEVIEGDIFEIKNLKSETVIGRAFKPLPVVLELMSKNFTNCKNLILFMGRNGKQTLNEAFKVWKFEYKEKMSLTSDDSFLINIKNIKKKFE
jgi:16S rRNA (guanine527-N7)-methyltransferase